MYARAAEYHHDFDAQTGELCKALHFRRLGLPRSLIRVRDDDLSFT